MQAFDPLCEVQSDKASVEITSPFEGVVKEIIVKEGDICKVGENLCLIEVDEEVAPELDASGTTVQETEEPPQRDPSPSTSKAPEITKSTTGESSPIPERRLHPLDPKAKLAPKVNNTDVLALPSVRHFARQNGVDLSLVSGSGRGGRIEKSNIEAYMAGSSSQAQTQNLASQTKQDDDVVIELGRTRQNMWKAMVKVSLSIQKIQFSNQSVDARALRYLILGQSGPLNIRL